jgi:hypothetical protein
MTLNQEPERSNITPGPRPVGEARLNIPPLRESAAEAETRRADLRTHLSGLLVGLVVVGAAVAGTFWWGFELGRQSAPTPVPPLLRADPAPIKETPTDPGGVRIPHQDRLVFDGVRSGGPLDQPEVRPSAPPLEEPLPRIVLRQPPAPPANPPRLVDSDVRRPGAPPAVTAPAPIPDRNLAPPRAGAPTPLTAGNGERSVPGVTGGSAPLPGQSAALPPQQVPLRSPQLAAPPSSPQAAVNPPTITIPTVTPPPIVALPAPPQAVVAAAPRGGFRIQLAAFRSDGAARAGWDGLRNAHRDVLANLSPTIVEVDLGSERGIFHRLQAGPFADAGAASAACDLLKQRNQGCIVVRP